MFGRRRRREADEFEHIEAQVGSQDAGQGEDEPGLADDRTGPWDSQDDVPRQERFDFGSLQVPAGDAVEVQVAVAEGQPAWITVVHGESSLQLQAFAAPKSSGLWEEVRREIAAEVGKAGGKSEESPGPFGVEVRVRIAPPQPAPDGRPGALEPVRFLGVDGPRWFLRGVVSGPAAGRDDLAGPLQRVFAGVVVNRGSHPVPPRELLEIRLSDQAQQALTEYMGAPQEDRWSIDPFERGPEITETR